jgi:hypothetical protein
VYFFLALFDVQRSAFAVTQAAREAGRAYATANNEGDGLTRAQVAARLAFADQGLPGDPQLRFAPQGANCGAANPGDGAATLAPGTRFVACVRATIPLPGASILGGHLAGVTVNGQFTVVIDQYRADRSGAALQRDSASRRTRSGAGVVGAAGAPVGDFAVRTGDGQRSVW